ncbi:uncharacterized protein LOC101860993 [Aplysia californica]|uniref:Uncharacterized protein LOC101860993 n=1 Tax=Aplysia californica TaxID=6500 RepID=A0ABM1A6M6_APLCA|nr:uncharacterized protein LOC101860993 [Aplysia californica]
MAVPGRRFSAYDKKGQLRRSASHSPTKTYYVYSKKHPVDSKGNAAADEHKRALTKKDATLSKGNSAHVGHTAVHSRHNPTPAKQRHAHSKTARPLSANKQHRQVVMNDVGPRPRSGGNVSENYNNVSTVVSNAITAHGYSNVPTANGYNHTPIANGYNHIPIANGNGYNSMSPAHVYINAPVANGHHQHHVVQQSQQEGAVKQGPPPPSQEVLHRPIIKRNTRDPESELATSFDPMKDRHMWTMWRTAVNGRILDEVQRLEKIRPVEPGLYGTALVTPPLRKFIRFGDNSKEIARHLMSQGKGRLLATQFIYYGLPRVYISNPQQGK